MLRVNRSSDISLAKGKPALARSQESIASLVIRRFMRRKTAVIGLILVVLIVGTAVAAPVLAPYPPNKTVGSRTEPPSAAHILGTDEVGRDVLSRIIYGARASLMVGVGAQMISALVGVVLGMTAGYYGGIVDVVVMRVVDVFMTFPFILLAILLVAALRPSMQNVILAVGLTGWTTTCRVVRGQTLSLREAVFVDAARAIGASNWRILRVHLLPNLMSVTVTLATIGIGRAIISESSLSYLGLGIQPPTPSWGKTLSFGQIVVFSAPVLTIAPSIAILLTVLGFNLLGDGLRDALDPQEATLRGTA
jgi:peptide/nickel transport system permease protein